MAQEAATRRGFEARLIAKAWKNDEFARELRANPKAVIQRELSAVQPGATLPADLDIQVLEETPGRLYLLLPRRPERSGELSDEQLAEVAGGGITYVHFGQPPYPPPLGQPDPEDPVSMMPPADPMVG